MNILPSENVNLYGLDRYFKEISDLNDTNKMPNKILLSGKKGLGKSTLAYHIVNYILSMEEDFKYDYKKFTINKNNKSYKLLLNNLHPNIFIIDLIDEKKNIDIDQIRKMINYTNKSSFSTKPRFIIIDNIECLNKNSPNALLKIVEEPNEKVFFILIHNNEKTILPTLKSRCLKFNISLTFKETIDITNLIIDDNILKIIHTDLISYYNTPGEFISLINFANKKKINLKDYTLKKFLNLLIDNTYYKKDKIVKDLLINFIELFFLKEYKKSLSKTSLLETYSNFISKMKNVEKFNLDEEGLFLEFKSKLLNG